MSYHLQNAQYCRIALASPEQIKAWTQRRLPNGKVASCVTEVNTLDYLTQRPLTDGLFCERIFGPVKSYACACGKFGLLSRYKDETPEDVEKHSYRYPDDGDGSPRFCKTCHVELTDSEVRRHRMGHIRLACQIIHVWYLRQRPSYIASFLDQKFTDIMELMYNFGCLVKPVVAKPTLVLMWFSGQSVSREVQVVDFDCSCRQALVDYLSYEWFVVLEHREVVMGADAVFNLLKGLRLEIAMNDCYDGWESTAKEWRWLEQTRGFLANKKRRSLKLAFDRLLRRLVVLKRLLQAKHRPEWVILSCLPVLPPALRPIVELRDGLLIAADLNYLYQRVICRNNRLTNLQKNRFSLCDMAFTLSSEHCAKRLLQEAVDSLLANGMGIDRTELVCDREGRPYKSFSAILKGKRGRFRQNLLGKRVDYSGRSVIVVGPSLSLHQCGLPSEMAIELFQPFLIRRLIAIGFAPSMRAAKKMLKPNAPIILRALSIMMRSHTVILNRAPTLHRLGIQGFRPVLVRERAIHLHPLVCTGFNADFDGDQMAVHAPLSLRARAEASTFMLPHANLLSPATGEAVVVPSHDMLLGLYVLTLARHTAFTLPKSRGPQQRQPRSTSVTKLPSFSQAADVLRAYKQGQLHHHSRVWLRCESSTYVLSATRREAPVELQYQPHLVFPMRLNVYEHLQIETTARHHVRSVHVLTTLGRVCFNQQIEGAISS